MRERFAAFADRISEWAGSPYTVAGVILTVLIWLAFGPVFGFSDTWQLLINTATTIFTWVLVHILQASQIRSDKATHTKLDAILKYIDDERADVAIGVEDKPEAEIDEMHDQLKT